MRANGKRITPYAHSSGLIVILLSLRARNSWKTRIWKKYQNDIDVHGDVLPFHAAQQ